MAYTSDALIANIKRRAGIPTAQNTYLNADFLDLIRDELWTYIVPIVSELRENFYYYDVDFTLSSYSGVFDIPTRAVGAKIVNMALIDGDRRNDISWIDEDSIEDIEEFPGGDVGAWIKRNQLILVPRTVSGWTTLRMTVLLRPGEPVLAADADVITAISSLTLTGTTVPSTWTTANTFELVQANPHFDSLGIALAAGTVTTGAAGSVVLSVTPSARLAVGDYIALNGQSPIIQAPEVCFALLSQKVAMVCMQGQADLEVMGKMESELYGDNTKGQKGMEDRVRRLLSPRVEKEGQAIVNRTGILRRNSR